MQVTNTRIQEISTQWEHIRGDTPVIGFAGGLGSGCTSLSEAIAKHHNYIRVALSAPLHEDLRNQGIPETIENLQTIGNKYRTQHGDDILVWLALLQADALMDQSKSPGVETRGIILDGIRNVGEAKALRHMPNSILISVQADFEKRVEWLLKKGRFKTKEECRAALERDADEKLSSGQQINLCTQLADIVVLNNEPVHMDDDQAVEGYVRRKFSRYLQIIHLRFSMRQRHQDRPELHEVLMTAAYAESRRSRCIKRKVGAIIASLEGDIISSGHNDVPEGMMSCWDDPEYQWCARDITQANIGKTILFCPGCGEPIERDWTCWKCGEKLTEFTKRCPGKYPDGHYCDVDPEIEYKCKKCGKDVFKEYLAGQSKLTGKMLDMCRSLHAEENAIIGLTRRGIVLPPGAAIYITAFPCNLCANKIVKAGIKNVVYSESYITKDAEDILKRSKGTTVTPFEGVKSSAYFRFY